MEEGARNVKEAPPSHETEVCNRCRFKGLEITEEEEGGREGGRGRGRDRRYTRVRWKQEMHCSSSS